MNVVTRVFLVQMFLVQPLLHIRQEEKNENHTKFFSLYSWMLGWSMTKIVR